MFQKHLPMFSTFLLAGCLMSLSSSAALVSGTYEGSAASVGGPIKVTVSVSEDEILSIDINEIHDSEGVYNVPAQRIPEMILENQTLDVDTVSGATLSSIFIRNAIKDAVSKAGDPTEFSGAAKYTAPAQEDMEADVVVIGGGIAGMSAAATAAHAGLKTIVVEKNAYVGGNALISDQYCLTGTTDPVISNWKPLIDDLNDMDIPADLAEYPGYGEDTLLTLPSTDHSVMYQLISGLREETEKNGGLILTDTPATGLIFEKGAVTGVTAQPIGQEAFAIRAKAVVLSTGGFSSSKDLVAKYLPYASEARCAGLGSNTGDAIAWAEEAGAKLVSMDAEVSSFYAFSPSLGFYAEFAFLPVHFIDLEGNLITDDTQYNTGAMKTFEAVGTEQFYTIISADEIAANGSQAEFDHMELAGTTKKYDSIEQIAQECALPNLRKTMEELGLEDGSYYASRAISEIYGTYGGVAVDDEAHVLNNDDVAIAGLYACGEVTGSHDYQLTGAYAGGLGPALTTGHIAGCTIAAEL